MHLSGKPAKRVLRPCRGPRGVIGHADRAEPSNDYCVGLLMPGERNSVRRAHGGYCGAGPYFMPKDPNRFYIWFGQAPWSGLEPFCRWSASSVLPGIGLKAGAKPGLSMTPGLRRRARIRSASRDDTEGGFVIPVQFSSRWSRLFIAEIVGKPVDRLPALSAGDMGELMRHGGKRHMCRKISDLKPSQQIALDRSAQPLGDCSPRYCLGLCGLQTPVTSRPCLRS